MKDRSPLLTAIIGMLEAQHQFEWLMNKRNRYETESYRNEIKRFCAIQEAEIKRCQRILARRNTAIAANESMLPPAA